MLCGRRRACGDEPDPVFLWPDASLCIGGECCGVVVNKGMGENDILPVHIIFTITVIRDIHTSIYLSIWKYLYIYIYYILYIIYFLFPLFYFIFMNKNQMFSSSHTDTQQHIAFETTAEDEIPVFSLPLTEKSSIPPEKPKQRFGKLHSGIYEILFSTFQENPFDIKMTLDWEEKVYFRMNFEGPAPQRPKTCRFVVPYGYNPSCLRITLINENMVETSYGFSLKKLPL
eukprot:gb/GECH01010119.1/.p1 GENE.gb/GECH01010119.1/~~gb/GECH01010119.1/.p1  ORF type:complete len:229 (+),score=27.55 gb/GECH01010119.1/:1-687(+)